MRQKKAGVKRVCDQSVAFLGALHGTQRLQSKDLPSPPSFLCAAPAVALLFLGVLGHHVTNVLSFIRVFFPCLLRTFPVTWSSVIPCFPCFSMLALINLCTLCTCVTLVLLPFCSSSFPLHPVTQLAKIGFLFIPPCSLPIYFSFDAKWHLYFSGRGTVIESENVQGWFTKVNAALVAPGSASNSNY